MAELPEDSIRNRIDRLLDEADAHRYGDRTYVLQTAAQATSLAQAAGDYERFAKGLYHQAWAAFTLNQLEFCLSNSLEALNIARGLGLTALEVDLVILIADAFVEGRLETEAEKLFEYALSQSYRVSDQECRARVLHDWAYFRLWKQDYNASARMFREAAALMSPGSHGGIDSCVAYGYLARSLYGLGRRDEAFRTADIAHEIARSTGNATIIGFASFTLASLHLSDGDASRARAYLDEAGETNSADFLALDVAMELIRAQCELIEGRHDTASALLENLYLKAVDRQLHRESVRVLELLKVCYEALGDMQGVIGAFERLTAEETRREARNADVRVRVLATVFAEDKAPPKAEMDVNTQKYELLHRLSHEFRTPLTVILSSAHLIEGYGERMPLERRQDHLKTIAGQVQALTAMLENITALLAEPATREQHGQFAPLSLTKLGQAAIRRIAAAGLESARIELATAPFTFNVAMSSGVLETIAFHLLHNALRYSSGAVRLELAVIERELTMRVSDSGIGIPQDEQVTVFEPLTRGSNQAEATGGGLGLAIVAKLTAELNGTITLTSAVGQGTTVTVRVPMRV